MQDRHGPDRPRSGNKMCIFWLVQNRKNRVLNLPGITKSRTYLLLQPGPGSSKLDKANPFFFSSRFMIQQTARV